MAKNRHKKNKKNAQGLSGELEQIASASPSLPIATNGPIASPLNDQLDTDISGHLDHFFTALSGVSRLPEFDLTSPESARAAAAHFEKTLNVLNAHQRTARALRTLLQSVDREGED